MSHVWSNRGPLCANKFPANCDRVCTSIASPQLQNLQGRLQSKGAWIDAFHFNHIVGNGKRKFFLFNSCCWRGPGFRNAEKKKMKGKTPSFFIRILQKPPGSILRSYFVDFSFTKRCLAPGEYKILPPTLKVSCGHLNPRKTTSNYHQNIFSLFKTTCGERSEPCSQKKISPAQQKRSSLKK